MRLKDVPVTSVEAPYGRRGLAAEPWPWKVRALFRENDIDETVLPNLTAEDLKELGVAVARGTAASCSMLLLLCAPMRAARRPADVAIGVQCPSVTPERPRRAPQVTVMFSDLVGSTRYSDPDGPWDLREVISAGWFARHTRSEGREGAAEGVGRVT